MTGRSPGPLPVRVLGGLLALVPAPVAALRRGRALHPQGATLHGTLELAGGPGSPLPAPGYRGPALVRVSRAAGLPPGLPDVHGVAVRWHVDGAPRDLLLSGTGAGRAGRFVLAPRRRPWTGAFSTIMPFRTRGGPLLLGAVPGPGAVGDVHDGDLRVDLVLLAARPGGPWQRCGRLVATERDDTADPRFDPVLHAPYGTYGWAAALRLPAYAASRQRLLPVVETPWTKYR
ncbi:hypothetical protein [Cellulomonas dongxiuzhuiae]|uniref:hypothetical protein n=1 Tax=Cellulomonas dongxiuzhuiae TaxID=2819979 RepID=UPI001AAF4D99|nr:hypothetical protein [Cellulomonas dongxiuzhuiae]MBO3087255.1 hypothetical protein [Cellulomonas dongxiuzhuiae]